MSRIVNVAAAQVGAIERSASRAEVVERLIAMMREAHRRGSDVVKALALGAEGVLVGRATLYGLAAAGEAGVTRAIDLLRDETCRTMAMLGLTSVSQIDEQALVRQG